MLTRASSTERIELRTTAADKDLLQRAADAAHKDITAFLLEAGLLAAAEVLADRRIFALDDAQWQAFQAALERPARKRPRLAKLLSETSALE